MTPFLGRTDILVALRAAHAGHARRSSIAPCSEKLARDGKLGGPILINAGRGGLQVEADILACLDDGTLKAATLDVFETEPLPEDSPLWTHPRVTVTPHNAATSEPEATARYIAEQIRRYEAGEPLQNVVDTAAGVLRAQAPVIPGRVAEPEPITANAVRNEPHRLAGASPGRQGLWIPGSLSAPRNDSGVIPAA